MVEAAEGSAGGEVPRTERTAEALERHEPVRRAGYISIVCYSYAIPFCRLTNLGADTSFYGSIAVGTPAVAYNVILDTGSS